MGSEISKKDITRLGFRSSLLQASFNYERMQAGGFTWAMLPILKKIYKDDKPGLSAAMKDNLEFINTHPNLVGFLMGLLISMEEKGENRDTIKGLKVFAIDSTHSVALQQDFFDKVFPNILPMAYTLLMYYFLRVKKAHPVLLIGVTFVLSIVCSAFGIL
ncbi:hypothetical protein D9J47_22125 [Escherichia coli]|nr:hypothetical protein [Escherichia coli]